MASLLGGTSPDVAGWLWPVALPAVIVRASIHKAVRARGKLAPPGFIGRMVGL